MKSNPKPRRARCQDCKQLFDKIKLKDGKCSACRCKSSSVLESKPNQSTALFRKQPTQDVESKPIKGLLAQRIQRYRESEKDSVIPPPHLIIEARAGTGKTTTLIEGLNLVKGLIPSIIPSPQQKAIWDQLNLSSEARSICFVAFNKSIAEELKKRVPAECDACTMHSMGYRAVRNAYPGIGNPNSNRVQDIISLLLETDIRDLRHRSPILLKATEELVGLCKMNLVGLDTLHASGLSPADILEEELLGLADYHDIELNGCARAVIDLVPRVLERCLDVATDLSLDFNDMIWLPIVLNLPVYKYDLLLVDEAQDLNRCQQALAKKAGHRLVFCGDPKQSIYGFAGADSQSMLRLERELSQTPTGCAHLPLNVTRRCSKAVVREAQKLVPDFEAFETNPEGRVFSMILDPSSDETDPALCYRNYAREKDLVICRCNAPLVGECFKFLRAGKKANINGRDIGQGLIKTINKMPCVVSYGPAASTANLIRDLDDWWFKETRKEEAKKNPNDNKLINLRDRHDCLIEFCHEDDYVGAVIQRIDLLFGEGNKGGILLSSIHKAKGLEAHRVFFLMPKEAPCPHPMAKLPHEKEQELNLLYVGQTRAIEELVYVR